MADTYVTLSAGRELMPGATAGGLAAVISNLANVSADVATLVADGASPTQAHVTTLNTDFGTLQARWNSFTVKVPTAAVFVNIDTTQVPTISVLRVMLNLIITQAAEQGMAP